MGLQIPDVISNDQYSQIEEWLVSNGFKTKNLNHRFSDATELAKILKKIYPKKVDLHNYTTCSAVSTKASNWNTLNNRVLQELNLRLTPPQIEYLIRGIPGAIEALLVQILNLQERSPKESNSSSVPQNTYSIRESNAVLSSLKDDLHEERQVIARLLREMKVS